ncbi:Exoribonuclease phosphorolytic domain 1 [Penicillium atrosanguineum]|nr:Exoribonuclease phosphorolytic domain 1 [Penicillium atrosanguineum]
MATPAANAAPSVSPSLSLPPSQFARLQPHAYLLAHLSPPASNQPSIRANGRAPSQFRVTSANAGSLTHTNGSAVVRIGDTTAVCGVRAEILHTDDIASWSVSSSSTSNSNKRRRLGEKTTDEDEGQDENEEDRAHIEDLNLLVPNLSLSTGCAPGFTPGAPPLCARSITFTPDPLPFAQHTSHPGGRFAHLQMEIDAGQGSEESDPQEIKAFWVLYIDVMIISLAGNPFDAAWAAVLAALRDTKLPKAWWDIDNETIICSDDISEASRLSLRGLPVASSFCVFEADAAAGWRAVVIPDVNDQKAQNQRKKGPQQKWILADPDGYEEGLSQERATLVVDKAKNGKNVILKMEKHGGWSVDTEDLRQLVEISGQRWDEMKRILDQC